MTWYVDRKMVLLALYPLHTTSHIDGGEASLILLALQTLHTTSYIDKGEASIIASREDVSETGGGSYKALLVVAVSFGLI
mmetsp:Transcript_3229/g.6808  ORF Transcript_3229/g.6808 Transcript_3229/m.6808 type:complete len:80 (+) Transcript_3229:191-430(+)